MKWQPTPVFLPGDLHGQRSLAGHSSWGHQESDMNEWLTHTKKTEKKKKIKGLNPNLPHCRQTLYHLSHQGSWLSDRCANSLDLGNHLNTGEGSHSLLQGIFQTQALNPCPLLCRQILYCLSHQERAGNHFICT